jgi:hypothetical protein
VIYNLVEPVQRAVIVESVSEDKRESAAPKRNRHCLHKFRPSLRRTLHLTLSRFLAKPCQKFGGTLGTDTQTLDQHLRPSGLRGRCQQALPEQPLVNFARLESDSSVAVEGIQQVARVHEATNWDRSTRETVLEREPTPPRDDWFKGVVIATLTRDTKSGAEIHRKRVLQPVEQGECVLHLPNRNARYPIRFGHKRTIERARKLRAGQRVALTKARLRTPFGRREVEVYVADFHLLN